MFLSDLIIPDDLVISESLYESFKKDEYYIFYHLNKDVEQIRFEALRKEFVENFIFLCSIFGFRFLQLMLLFEISKNFVLCFFGFDLFTIAKRLLEWRSLLIVFEEKVDSDKEGFKGKFSFSNWLWTFFGDVMRCKCTKDFKLLK